MASVNDELFDAANRHQVFLVRFAGAETKQVVKLLQNAERDLNRKLRKRLKRLGPIDRQEAGKGLVTTQRLQALLADVRQVNRDLRTAVGRRLTKSLKDLAEFEADLVTRRLDEAFGVNLGSLRPAPELLTAAVTEEPLRGRTLKSFVKTMTDDQVNGVTSAVQLGLVEGDTPGQLMRRVRDQYGVTRRKAEALTRTAVNHVGNRARELTYQANSDLIEELRWTSTLDGRTSPICQARDGKTFPLDEGPRPPAHPNCRSLMTPVTKSWEKLMGRKLKRGRGSERIDTLFRRALEDKGLSPEQVAAQIRNARASLDGQVPGTLTYQDWLRRQPKGFRREVLGKTRAKLFDEGKLPLDKFVDLRTGRSFTLDTLRDKETAAFSKAGLKKDNGRST